MPHTAPSPTFFSSDISLLLKLFPSSTHGIIMFGHTLLQIQAPVPTKDPKVSLYLQGSKPHAHATLNGAAQAIRCTKADESLYLSLSLDKTIESELRTILTCAPVYEHKRPNLNMPYNLNDRQARALSNLKKAGVITDVKIVDPHQYYQWMDKQFYFTPEHVSDKHRMGGHYHGGLWRAIYFAIDNWHEEGFRCTGFALTCIQAAYLRHNRFLEHYGLSVESKLKDISQVVAGFAALSRAERIRLLSPYLPRALQIDGGLMQPMHLYHHLTLQKEPCIRVGNILEFEAFTTDGQTHIKVTTLDDPIESVLYHPVPTEALSTGTPPRRPGGLGAELELRRIASPYPTPPAQRVLNRLLAEEAAIASAAPALGLRVAAPNALVFTTPGTVLAPERTLTAPPPQPVHLDLFSPRARHASAKVAPMPCSEVVATAASDKGCCTIM